MYLTGVYFLALSHAVENMMDQLKTSPLLKDDELIIAVKSGGLAGEKAIIALYARHHQEIKTCISKLTEKYSGCKCEPQDIVHDSFIVMLDKIQKDTLQTSSLRCFWLGIARNVWLNHVKKNKRIILVEDDQELYGSHDINPEVLFLTNEKNQLLDDYLSQCGSRCKEILLLWVSHYSSQDIADRFHLSGPAMARKIKHKCFKKLKELIEKGNKLKSC